MRRRLISLLAILAVLIVCYGILLRVTPAPGPLKPPTFLAAPPNQGGLMPPTAQEDPGEYEDVTVKIEIPSLAEFPPGWAVRRGCPHIRLSRVLGAAVGTGAGVPVLRLEPGKPAAEAGIRPGDRLGGPGDCPTSLYDHFAPRKEPRTIGWTVRRPKGEGSGNLAAGSAPAPRRSAGRVPSP